MCLADEVLREVVSEKTTASLWLKLESLYMTKSTTNQILLKGRLSDLRLEEGKPLKPFLNELETVVMDLRNIDMKVEDEDLAVKLLWSLL